MSLVDKAMSFIKAERLYLLMFIFVIAFNFLPSRGLLKEEKPGFFNKRAVVVLKDKISSDEKFIRNLLEKNRSLVALINRVVLVSALVLILGIFLLIRQIRLRLTGRPFIVTYDAPHSVNWKILDVFKVMATFFFFSYVFMCFEFFIFPVSSTGSYDGKLATIIHSAIMDVTAIFIVIYFTVKKFKGCLAVLGVSLRNLLKNLKVGLVSYVSFLPILTLIFVIVIAVLQMTGYEQPPSPVLEIFYEESRPGLLMVMTILVAIIGPVAEELFFRGFAYPAVKKRFGIKVSIAVVSVVFATLHMNPVAFFPIVALGILLSYLYEKTGSLIPSIAVHIIHNSVILFFAYLYKALGSYATGG